MDRKRLDINDYQNPSDEFKRDVAFANAVLNRVYDKIGGAMRVDKSRLGGIVHGREFVLSDTEHQAKRDLLDKHYQSERFTRSTNDDDGEVVVTINVPNKQS